jgi:pilus assembly protein CpaE
MNKNSGTILVTSDPEVRTSVGEAFGNDALLTPFSVCGTMRELEKLLEGSPSGLVLVDIEPEPVVMLEYVEQLVNSKPRCRFVVIAPDFDRQLLLDSMQAGARHFLPKAWIGAEIVPICRELAEQVRGVTTTRGVVYTVVPASGGCGSTTVAINLAAESGLLDRERSLLVDFDTRYGGVAAHLGVHGEYGLADLLSRESVDSELVKSTAVERGEWVDALLSPSSINFREPAPLYLDELDEVLSVFRSGYPTTVIDAPALPFEAVRALAERSTALVIVLQLSVIDLQNTRTLLQSLGAHGVKTPIRLVANRVRGTGKPISLKEAATTLDFKEGLLALPDEPIPAMKALNAGESLLKIAPTSKLRRQFQRIAAELRGGESEEAGQKRAKGRKKAA